MSYLSIKILYFLKKIANINVDFDLLIHWHFQTIHIYDGKFDYSRTNKWLVTEGDMQI